ncbi:MAG: heme ABC exporter ATP-binding protein CcmA [Hyphomicrobiaceae bacterium]
MAVRGGRTILHGVSFTVAAGEALVLTGPNGAGKTTLIRTVAGLLPPLSGVVSLDGGDDARDLAEQAHYVGHLNAVKPGLTVAENARFWADFLGGSGQAAWAALERFRLDALAEIPAAYLSAGQKRRLSLARLLVAPRPLWLLDEPTVSLDQASRLLVAEAIDAHLAAGGLVLAATHLPLGLAKAREWALEPAPSAEVGP